MVNRQNPYLNPSLKKVEPEFGNSFVLRNFNEKLTNQIPSWHYHPELELIYIHEGSGKRHIGNHISFFNEGDLIMIGSNLPHYGFASRLSGENQEIVLQIHESCFGVGFLDMVETSSIKNLFEKSKLGLSFSGETKSKVGESLQSMFYMTPFERMMELIKILHILSRSEECEILDANGHSVVIKGNDNYRIDRIYEFVRENFMNEISLVEIGGLVNMTVPALCRFFKKSTNKTFVQFLNEYRTAHACKLLSERRDYSISMIAGESGFNNISNFNRIFKKVTGKSPSEYRQSIKRILMT